VIPIIFLYPVFGLVQQFMMIGLIAGNLKAMRNISFRNYQIILITSLLFSLVHYPSVFLMVFTFIMELAFVLAYFKWRNLWSLGLYHGLIGCLLLFYVLERDLWLELWPVL
jgi:membrane protease YdiL (CAAX protease family)